MASSYFYIMTVIILTLSCTSSSFHFHLPDISLLTFLYSQSILKALKFHIENTQQYLPL